MGQPDAAPQPTPVLKPPFLRTRLLPAFLSAGLLYLCFFPVNWGWLAWIALTPILWLTAAPDSRRVQLAAWLGGLVFFIAATEWIRLASEIMYVLWVILALILSVAFPIFVWLTRLLTFRLGVPLVFAAPSAWVASEYIRANLNVGFSWYYLGHSQHDTLPLVQIADLFGAYGVSFVVVAVNVLIFQLSVHGWSRVSRSGLPRVRGLWESVATWANAWKAKVLPKLGLLAAACLIVTLITFAVVRSYGQAPDRTLFLLWVVGTAPGIGVLVLWFVVWTVFSGFETAALAAHAAVVQPWDDIRALLPLKPALLFAPALVLVSLLYGVWRLSDEDFGVGPKLALIQGDLPQYIHDDKNAVLRTRDHFAELAAAAQLQKPELIVWSETSYPFILAGIGDNMPADQITSQWKQNAADGKEMLRILAANYNGGIPSLIGLNAIDLEACGEVHYNTAVLLDGTGQLLGRYDKIECVPIGEYMPYEEYIPIIKWLSPYSAENDYGICAGKKHTIFEFLGRRFGVLICYEDSVPHLARMFMRRDDAPDYFLNISNDGWFHGSQEHEQHLVSARFRAIECRRAIARAVNMGISCIIDGNGRIHGLPGETWADSKSRTAVVTGTVPIDSRSSLYILWGDVLPWACWILCLAGVVAALLRGHEHCKLQITERRGRSGPRSSFLL